MSPSNRLRTALREWLWLLGGSSVVVYGGSLAAVSAFDGDFLRAYVGFLLFGLGYRSIQLGLREGGVSAVRDRLDRTTATGAITKYGLLNLGIGIATVGGVIGAQTVGTLDIWRMAVAGVAMSGGYVIGHVGLNDAWL
ncbi:hypothetical protein [Haloplanus aerogenes]|uniref:Uncharacterized protein n=1 Tax=Haloplanus aerogenes TaxID=660522 RepID=A0A3G8QVN2_9EURY|nr:hypothetical protein [Haloplanus aerogenes]AZH25791.1 hypothetical protein DU502_10555 [Haloplanus aerogenes]